MHTDMFCNFIPINFLHKVNRNKDSSPPLHWLINEFDLSICEKLCSPLQLNILIIAVAIVQYTDV